MRALSPAAAVLCLALGLLCAPAAAASDVLELNPSSFKQMLASDDIYFVEFYAPWCAAPSLFALYLSSAVWAVAVACAVICTEKRERERKAEGKVQRSLCDGWTSVALLFAAANEIYGECVPIEKREAKTDSALCSVERKEKGQGRLLYRRALGGCLSRSRSLGLCAACICQWQSG